MVLVASESADGFDLIDEKGPGLQGLAHGGGEFEGGGALQGDAGGRDAQDSAEQAGMLEWMNLHALPHQ